MAAHSWSNKLKKILISPTKALEKGLMENYACVPCCVMCKDLDWDKDSDCLMPNASAGKT